MYNYRERRNEARITQIKTVYYTCHHGEDLLPGITVDVSNSGVSIYTPPSAC